jgi:hypothetical protein
MDALENSIFYQNSKKNTYIFNSYIYIYVCVCVCVWSFIKSIMLYFTWCTKI